MSHEQNDQWLLDYLDGELRGEDERQALLTIAENPELRELLRLELKLPVAFNEGTPDTSFQVPEGFSDRVMNRIEADTQATEESDRQGIVHALFARRTMDIRPVYLAAALLLLAVGFSVIGLPGSSQQPVENGVAMQPIAQEQSSEIWMRFVYFDDSAETIEVAGDFSDWQPLPLSRETMGDQQVWTGLVPLSRGEHSYMFIRNGDEWTTDPLADVTRDDGFGNKNAVIYL
ncbi:MAG: hypothetical protein ACNA78_04210 [Balneolaceae bacterium]